MATMEAFDLSAALTRDRAHLRISSRVEWVEKVVMFLRDRAAAAGVCDEAAARQLVVCLTEAITNAIVHGNLEISSELKSEPGHAFAQALAERSGDPLYAERVVDIVADFDGRRCTWTITDQGRGFDFAGHVQKLEREEDPAALLTFGRGIMLMKAMMSDVAWSREGREVRLTLDKAGEQRRAEDRTARVTPVRLMTVYDDGSVDVDGAFDGVTLDVSAGGAGLLHRGLPHASRLLIELSHEGKPVYLPAQVCHMHAVGGGVMQIGCRFDHGTPAQPEAGHLHPRSAEAIERLLAAHAAPAETDERRAHQRAAYTVHVEIGVHPDQPRHPAVTRDLSKSGAAIIAGYALPLGAVVEIHLPTAAGEAVHLRARVARCQKLAGAFHDIGLQFVGE